MDDYILKGGELEQVAAACRKASKDVSPRKVNRVTLLVQDPILSDLLETRISLMMETYDFSVTWAAASAISCLANIERALPVVLETGAQSDDLHAAFIYGLGKHLNMKVTSMVGE